MKNVFLYHNFHDYQTKMKNCCIFILGIILIAFMTYYGNKENQKFYDENIIMISNNTDNTNETSHYCFKNTDVYNIFQMNDYMSILTLDICIFTMIIMTILLCKAGDSRNKLYEELQEMKKDQNNIELSETKIDIADQTQSDGKSNTQQQLQPPYGYPYPNQQYQQYQQYSNYYYPQQQQGYNNYGYQQVGTTDNQGY